MFPTLSRTTLACVLLGAQALCHAQTENQGKVSVEGVIGTATCALSFQDNQSATGGVKTLAFGTIPNSKVPKGKFKTLDQIGGKTVLLSVKSANDSPCSLLGNWDVAINIEAVVSQTDTDSDTDVMEPSKVNASLKKMGIYLATTINGTEGKNKVKFKQKKLYYPFGAGGTGYTLLSDSNSTQPGLSSSDKLALTVKLMTTDTDADTSTGSLSATIPLFVFYK